MSTEKKAAPVTPFGRVSFPELVVPTSMEEEQKKKFSLILLFPGDEPGLKKLEAEVAAAIVEKWPAKAKDAGFLAKLEMPIHEANEKEYDGYQDGWKFIRFSTSKRPVVKDQRKETMQADMNTKDYPDLYPGCWARVSYNVFAWEYKNKQGAIVKRGVSFGLFNVQKVRDDDAFGGGYSDADEDFDEIDEDLDAAGLLD